MHLIDNQKNRTSFCQHCPMSGGRIFYVGGQRKIDTVEHEKSKETEVLMIKESTDNKSLVYLFINTNLS